ncbi:MAG: hypothetical protein GY710_13085 [Desulfobacteraceae bacterium]|nr:hypothetical protein [Desulfobacteraceae bacterium]
MLKKAWKDPIWSKVIAWGIIAAIIFLWGYFTGAFSVIKGWVIGFPSLIGGWISYSWKFLWLKSEVAHWLLLLMSIICLLAVIALILRIKESLSKKQEITQRDYKRRLIDGLDIWWDYVGNYNIINISIFCPKCEYQIMPEFLGLRPSAPKKVCFICSNCEYRANDFIGNWEAFNRHVSFKIQHDLRTGKWEELANQSAEAGRKLTS